METDKIGKDRMVVLYPSPKLIMELHNEKPLSASDLSDLFSSLAKDYKRISRGRELVVESLSTGSLLAIFKDAAEFAAAANSIINFGMSISYLFDALRTHGLDVTSLPRLLRKPGGRTAEQLLKTAVNGKASVDLKYVGPEGEKLFAKVTPNEAHQMQLTITNTKAARKLSLTKKGNASLPSPELMESIDQLATTHSLSTGTSLLPAGRDLLGDLFRTIDFDGLDATSEARIWNALAEILHS